MDFHILGLFPEILDSYFQASLLGKARKEGRLQFHYHQLRDWGVGSYNQVDDKTYGGGSGMVFLPEVTVKAVRDLRKQHQIAHVVLPTPSGKLFTAQKARELAEKKSILFLCGRYEGVDQRAIDLVVDEEICIGDYVLTGGEMAAGVMIDACARFVPEVIGKNESVTNDSFETGLLEHPHFTRPEIFEGQSVPEVLLSGHHEKIEEWRRKESLRKTWQRRPELLKKANLNPKELKMIQDWIHGKGL